VIVIEENHNADSIIGSAGSAYIKLCATRSFSNF